MTLKTDEPNYKVWFEDFEVEADGELSWAWSPGKAAERYMENNYKYGTLLMALCVKDLKTGKIHIVDVEILHEPTFHATVRDS